MGAARSGLAGAASFLTTGSILWAGEMWLVLPVRSDGTIENAMLESDKWLTLRYAHAEEQERGIID